MTKFEIGQVFQYKDINEYILIDCIHDFGKLTIRSFSEYVNHLNNKDDWSGIAEIGMPQKLFKLDNIDSVFETKNNGNWWLAGYIDKDFFIDVNTYENHHIVKIEENND